MFFLIGSEVRCDAMGVHVDNLRCEAESFKCAEIASEAKRDGDDA